MSFCDWLIVADATAAALFAAGYVWLGAKCWADLQRKPAVRRHPGHYGTQEVR
jgi:hypothetical protein